MCVQCSQTCGASERRRTVSCEWLRGGLAPAAECEAEDRQYGCDHRVPRPGVLLGAPEVHDHRDAHEAAILADERTGGTVWSAGT